MTTATARTAANVALATTGLVLAYFVMTKPPLRRLAVRGFELWLGASIPVYLLTEVRRAWVQSARA